jgi:hypothetical protein
MARPTKLTAKLAVEIIKLVEAGNYVEVAAAACGIGRRTYYDWMDRGRKALDKSGPISAIEQPYADLAERVEVATARAEIAAVDKVRKQSKLWQASMTYLERRFPDRWGRRQAIEHSGPNGAPITARLIPADVMRALPRETLKAIAEGRAIEDAGAAVPHPNASGSDRSAERSRSPG